MTETTRIPFLAGRLSEAASNFILNALKREGYGDLLPCHGDILHVLTRQETATVVELARLTRRSKSTASALVAKLVDLGYIEKERSCADSRVVHLRLTEKGRAFLPVSERISQELHEIVTKGLNEDEIRQAENLLVAVLNHFDDKSQKRPQK